MPHFLISLDSIIILPYHFTLLLCVMFIVICSFLCECSLTLFSDTMNLLLSQTSILRDFVNECLKGKEPWQIVTMTTSVVLTTVWMYHQIFHDESMYHNSFQISHLFIMMYCF